MAVDRLRIRTLGGLFIERGGEAVDDLASSKAEALLVFLACTRREHPREVLAELLWDDRTQRQALANLRVVLSSLRKEVGPFVSITRSTAGIRGEADVRLDVVQLESAATAMQESEGAPSAAAVEALEEAVALYEGDFLAGFFLPEAIGFENWAAGERERLHRLALDALVRLGRWYLNQAEYPAAIATSTRLVQLDPLAEVGHRQLMEALARNGQRAEALAQFETCRQILAEELGLEPETETQALREAIRQEWLGAASTSVVRDSAEIAVLPDFLAAPRTAPADETPFLGRRQVLERLEEEFQEVLRRGARPVFVSGEAGSGKTALVQKFVRRVSEAAPEAVVALGHSSTLGGAGGAYQPFRQILHLLCGDIEEALASGDLGQEQGRRLWKLMPLAARAIVEEGPNLPGVLVNGRSLLGRLRSALPESAPWLNQMEGLVGEARAEPGEVERSVLETQFAAVLRALARERPLVLVLEDVHWADKATINLLFQLGRGLGALPILLLATYRPEELHGAAGEERPLLEKVVSEFKRDFGHIVVDLDEIGRAEGRAFVDEIVDSRPNELGESFRQALYRRTGGHPLFTMELLRALRQRGILQRDEAGSWQVAAQIEWDELPAQIEGVLEERLARLPSEPRRLLDVAALEGETFTAQVIAQALHLGEREVVLQLSNAVEQKHRLIQSLGSRRLGRQRLSRYRFRHELFRKFLYETLPEVERSYLHEDVGLALEDLYEGQTEAIAGQLAWHFTEAGEAEKGLRYSLQAAEQARLAYAHADAANHYENALVFLREKEEPAPLARTLMKLGVTYQMALEHRRARRTFEEGFAAWQRAQRHIERGQLPPPAHPFRKPYNYEPETLDPTRMISLLAAEIVSQIFSGLIENRGGTESLPDVANRWEIRDDGRALIFHLGRDVRWSDGHPLTAEDFIVSWRRALDPSRASGITTSEMYDVKGARSYSEGEAPADALGLQAPDPYTLVVELERPSGQFLDVVHCPVPAHVLRRHGEEWAAPEHLVSNGPFRLARWSPRREIVFERNPYYHGHFPGNVERVVYPYANEWPAAEELYAEDVLDVLPISWIPALERARRRYAADYVSAPWLQTTLLYFDVAREPFHDPRVRRALALAIDRQNMADVHLDGLFFPAGGGMVPPGIAGHSPDINLTYAPQEARELLSEAGYPGGRNFPRVVARGHGSGIFATIREAVQAQWRRVLGLDLNLQPTAWGEPTDDAQVTLTAWVAGDHRYPSYFLDTYARIKRLHGRNDALDALLERARETLEPQARLALYRQADRLLVQEALLSPLLYGRAHYLIKPWVRGYLPTGMGGRWKDLVIEPH